MSGENQGIEYIKIIKDILETELSLKPAIATSVDETRVFLYNQVFNIPTYDYMFLVLSENPGKVMANRLYMNEISGVPTQIQELIMQKEINIDIFSRNNEARQRKEEVLMALASTYSEQAQEANGFKVFSYSVTFVDISETEGAGRLNRYRASVMLHCRYTKQKSIDYYDLFGLQTYNN